MSARPVLIVDDDAVLRATLAEHLIAEGSFRPEVAARAVSVWSDPQRAAIGCNVASSATPPEATKARLNPSNPEVL